MDKKKSAIPEFQTFYHLLDSSKIRSVLTGDENLEQLHCLHKQATQNPSCFSQLYCLSRCFGEEDWGQNNPTVSGCWNLGGRDPQNGGTQRREH